MHTTAAPLEHALRTAGARTAVICGDERIDYAALHDRCCRLVGALQGLGLGHGDRVAVLAANCHRYIEAHLGLPAGGMVIVPLNTRHAEAELLDALRRSGARVLLTDREPGALAGEVETVISFGDEYEARLRDAEPSPLGRDVSEDDVAAIFFTGGTTGRSKGVVLTHRNLVANAFHKTLACGFQRDDVLLAAGPLFHVAGTAPLLGLVWLGAGVVVLPTFDPGATLDLIARHRVTTTLPVPTMIAALVEEQRARPRDVSSLRLLGHAASPMATELLRRAHATFPGAELAHFYGATETAPIVTCLRHEERELDGPHLGSCGQPVPGVEVRIAALEGGEARHRRDRRGAGAGAERDAGLLARSPGDGGGPGRRLVPDRRPRLPGRGELLFLVDRAKDMIVSGGENVYSVEVENALYQHPAVLEAAVFGVPDERWGEAVRAVVVVRPEVVPDDELAEQLRVHCRTLIAGYKVPKSIALQLEPLPKSGPGKVLKRQLRDQHRAEVHPR